MYKVNEISNINIPNPNYDRQSSDNACNDDLSLCRIHHLIYIQKNPL